MFPAAALFYGHYGEGAEGRKEQPIRAGPFKQSISGNPAQQPRPPDASSGSILQMTQPRPREMESPAQGHTAG